MITIVGVPGSGKTTLAKLVGERLNMPYLPEPVEDNPYLNQYYKDPKSCAFPMQIFLLHSMFQHINNSPDKFVMDMHMYGNDLFAKLQSMDGTMSANDYNTYLQISGTLKSMVREPDLLVYLECSPVVAIERILSRGRDSELTAPVKYWVDLNSEYRKWYLEYPGNKMKLNVDVLNFKDDFEGQEYAVSQVQRVLRVLSA